MRAQAMNAADFSEDAAGRTPRRRGRAARVGGRERRDLAGALLAVGVWLGGTGCSDVEETRTLPARQVAISSTDAPIYDDGELTIFESKLGVPFPILAPTREQRRALNREVPEPYPQYPWVEVDDLKVQVSWLVSNLDPETHVVGVLVDPWNECGRYWPGLSLVNADNGEYLPNLSGYERLIEVP